MKGSEAWLPSVLGSIAAVSICYVGLRMIRVIAENLVLQARVGDAADSATRLDTAREHADTLRAQVAELTSRATIAESGRLGTDDALESAGQELDAIRQEVKQTTEKCEELQTEAWGLRTRVEQLRALEPLLSERGGLVATQGQQIAGLEEQLGSAQADAAQARADLEGAVGRLELADRSGLEGYIESMREPEFHTAITDHFGRSHALYILASRALTLLGAQAEPFHRLLAPDASQMEIPVEQKDMRILLANPVLNLKRTKQLAVSPDRQSDDDVLASCVRTMEQILRYRDAMGLQVRVLHQTASWRLIMLDEIALLSSYRRVKYLPIYVGRPGADTLYDGFRYHFQKLFEIGEDVGDLSSYEQMITRTREQLRDGSGELLVPVRDVAGI